MLLWIRLNLRGVGMWLTLAIATCAAGLLLTRPASGQSEIDCPSLQEPAAREACINKRDADKKPDQGQSGKPDSVDADGILRSLRLPRAPGELDIDCSHLRPLAARDECIKRRDAGKKPEQVEYDTPDSADVRLARRSLKTKTPVTFERGRIKLTGTVLSVERDKDIWHIRIELAGN